MNQMIVIANKNKKDISCKSRELVAFCLKNSKEVVLTRRHTGPMPADILRELVDKELEEIEERSAKQILFSETVSKKELKRIQMKDRSTLKKYFINQAKEEKYVARQYIRQYEDGYDHLEEDLKPYGLIKRDYKLGSFFTWPGVWDICFFKKDSIDYGEFELYFFTYPIQIEDDYEFEDIGFKSESGLIWLKTCSHENYFEMELTQKQYESFKKIGIAHEIL